MEKKKWKVFEGTSIQNMNLDKICTFFDARHSEDVAKWLSHVPESVELCLRVLSGSPLYIGRCYLRFDCKLGKVSGKAHVSSGQFLYESFIQLSREQIAMDKVAQYTLIQRRDMLFCSHCISQHDFMSKSKISGIKCTDGQTSTFQRHLQSHGKVLSHSLLNDGDTLDSKICLAIADNHLAFRIVDSPTFRNLFPGDISHRTKMSSEVLSKLSARFRTALKEACKDQIVHVGFDLWTSSNLNHYLVSTLHWIDRGWDSCRAGLDLLPLAGQCADDIVKVIRASFAKTAINENQIASVCTDGASNEVAAATFPGFCPNAEHIWCLVHKLNLVVGDAFHGRCRSIETVPLEKELLPTPVRPDDKRFWEQVNRGGDVSFKRNRSSSIATIKDLCKELMTEYSIEDMVDLLEEDNADAGIQKQICDVLKISSAMEVWTVVRGILSKCRRSHLLRKDVKNMVQSLNSSRKDANQEEKVYHQFVLYAKTRFIGSYYELKSFNEHQDVFQKLMETDWKSRMILPLLFFPICVELEQLLAILKVPIDLIQLSSIPVVSWQLYLIRSMREQIAAHDTQTIIGSNFKETLLHSIDTRLGLLLDTSSDDDDFMQFKLCEFVDPTTSQLWTSDIDQLRDYFLKVGCEMDSSYDLGLGQSIKKRKRSESESSNPMDMFYQCALGRQKENVAIPDKSAEKISLSDALSNEFFQYRTFVQQSPVQSKCLEWWKVHASQFPLISRLAQILLAQPIGTPDVERRCSEAGDIITKLRNRLSHEKAANLFFIHSNASAGWVQTSSHTKDLFKRC